MAAQRTRLDRYISKQLNISLKEVRLLLARKEVFVDGHRITDPSTVVDKFSKIICREQVLAYSSPVYLMLNKPVGVVSATKDECHTTVMDFIGHEQHQALHIVGRLDLNTSGLVLLTNDGRWSERLMAPDFKVKKYYRVELENELTNEYVDAFSAGMYFEYEDITTAPVELKIINTHQAIVALTEGRYHQIKRMFGRFRNPVLALHRYQIGAIKLDDSLAPGQWRQLTQQEVTSLANKL